MWTRLLRGSRPRVERCSSEPADRPWGARMFQFNDLDGFKLGVSTPLVG